MSAKKMLIDATHAEETRVVIVDGKRLEDFDVEVASRRQLKGNIYLAKVTRVEPSLQAAFVDFGGNRHGFLAFNEIHPDYYQIPVADREALIAEQLEATDEDDENDSVADANTDEEPVQSVGGDDTDEVAIRRPVNLRRQYKIQEVIKRRQILLIQVVKEERGNKGAALTTYISLPGRYCVLMPNTARGGGISRKIANTVDRRKLKTILNEFKIPPGVAVIVRTAGSKRTKAEIKRDYDYLMRLWNQVRETTLESIAPCLVHEEGNLIKRAIRDLYSKDVEDVIVEGNEGYRIAKDFMKLLIPSHSKRVQPYKDATVPLLHRYQVESQLDAMHDPVVSLKSGGYIVLSQTEALVAIDVNSGKATKERNIEETALQTNLEAAEEVARQLRLRDLAGLVVIDFIDMEIHRNQAKVERLLKDAMKNDRARIQMGRISPFGLLELSRQRLRPSLMESSTGPCPHCGGTGALRSVESAALSVIRAIEEEGMRGRSTSITVHVATSIALYILNQKRAALAEIESRYGFSVTLASDDTLIAPDHRIDRVKGTPIGGERIIELYEEEDDDDDKANEESVTKDETSEEDSEDGAPRKRRRRRSRRRGKRTDEETTSTTDNSDEPSGSETADGETPSSEDDASGEDTAPKKRRRGRRGGRKRSRNRDEDGTQTSEEANIETGVETSAIDTADVVADGNSDTSAAVANADSAVSGPADAEASAAEKPKRSPRRSRKKADSTEPPASPETSGEPSPDASSVAPEAPEKPKRAPRPRRKKSDEESTPESGAPEAATVVEIPIVAADPAPEIVAEAAKTNVIVVGAEETEKTDEPPRRGGWWRRS